MGERLSGVTEVEVDPAPPLDAGRVLDALFDLAGPLGLKIDLDDREVLDALVGRDCEEFSANLAELAAQSGLDTAYFFEYLQVAVERRARLSQKIG